MAGGPWENYAPEAASDGPWSKYRPAPADARAPMSWTDVASGAIANAPASAWQFGKDIAQPFLHPIETAKSVANLTNSTADMADAATNAFLAPYVERFIPDAIKGESLSEPNYWDRYAHALDLQKRQWGGDERVPEAVAAHFADRYGGVENIKRTLASDPVGVAGDVSAVLTAGGSAAARAPGIVGKAGEIARAAGDMANPLMLPAKGIGAISDEAKRLTRPINAPTTEELYDAADAAYHDPSIKDLVVKPSAFQQWKDQAVVELNNEGFNDVLSPKSFGVLQKLSDVPAGGFVTGQTFETLRRSLKKAAAATDPTEAETARRLISSLDDFLGNVPKGAVLRGDTSKVSAALTDARGNYAAAKRSDQIDDALERAQRQAGAANSGMNLDNATRQRVKDILNSAKKRRGFSDEEIAQMEAIVRGSKVENLSRRIGNMLGGGGGLGTTLVASGGAATGAASGHVVGAAIGAMAPVIGYGFKKLSAAMSQADVRRLQELVRSRSPLGRQMQSSLGKFGKAGVAANGSPSPQNIARLMLASRNLSSNLLDAGINLPPETIVGALAGQNNSGN